MTGAGDRKIQDQHLPSKRFPWKGETCKSALPIQCDNLSARAYLNVKGTQREEPGSDRDGRECRSGQVFLGEVTPELHLKDELELGERGLWVKT